MKLKTLLLALVLFSVFIASASAALAIASHPRMTNTQIAQLLYGKA